MKNINIRFFLILILGLGTISCVNTKEKSSKSNIETDQQYYVDLGQKISSSTQAVLGKNLINALAKGGPEHALEFCNSKAIPLTDSMATVLKATIKRVSDIPRNSNNKANSLEKSIIASQKESIKNGEQAKPDIREIKGKMVAYYPIVTNGMCLQCHGKVNQMVQQKTFDKIKNLYPKDQAMGYDVNQLRGMWVVEMKKADR